MSQMYSINEQKVGDETISEDLDTHYAAQGIRVFGLAAPNLNNEEALLLLAAVLASEATTPRVFIYGVCFDKFRNVGVRPEMKAFLAMRPDVVGLLKTVGRESGTRYPAAAAMLDATLAEVVTQPAEEVSFEQHVRTRVASALPLVKGRTDLNAYFQERVYFLRNAVFRISATSKRPILQSRYDANREFLGMLADLAASKGVELVLYVIPLNPLAETPYIPDQYAAFKEWLAQFSHERGLPFANFEAIVPTGEWGLFNGAPDFKHFKGTGHRITAAAIRGAFDSVIISGSGHGDPRR